MQEFLQALAQQMQQNQNAMQQLPPEALQNILRQQDLGEPARPDRKPGQVGRP